MFNFNSNSERQVSAGKKFILTEGTFSIKGTAETIQIMDCALDNGDKSFYYPEETAKRKIALHFTMGYLVVKLIKDIRG